MCTEFLSALIALLKVVPSFLILAQVMEAVKGAGSASPILQIFSLPTMLSVC